MNIVDKLFYKTDEYTNEKRISKTKIITCLVFIIFFAYALNMYLTGPAFKDFNILFLVFCAIFVGLIFAVPCFIIGWLIGKFLNRNKNKNLSQNKKITSNQYTNQIETQLPENSTETVDVVDDKPCPHNYAKEFKEAVENDDSELAHDLLSPWNKDDANYKYASIIFEGMPPSTVSLTNLNEWLNDADNMKACDESYRQWFRSTALEVIDLNKQQ